MKHPVTVTVRKAFTYLGRPVEPGAVIQMAALDASIYLRKQLITASHHRGLNTTALQPDVEPEPAPDPEPVPADVPTPRRRGRGRYRRRDLVADEA